MRQPSHRILAGLTCLSFAALLGGCIVSDELCTITIHPDGSADFIKTQSNVHSSETGDKADEELRSYIDQFNARKDADHERISAAGGEVRESRFIRSEKPFATVIVGKLPSAAALEKAFTFKGDHSENMVTAKFSKTGARRKFSMKVALPAEEVADASIEKTVEELRAAQANGLSETRFAVAEGKIVDSRGFTVAGDKQSALLEPKAILEMLKTKREVEVFLEWEL